MDKKIFVIAGEASGDLHGANLIRSLRSESKAPLVIYGVGGDKIRETGALEFFDLAHFHVTGLTAAIQKLPEYRRAEKRILSAIQNVRPDLVVLIDNPGFNLHLAAKIHAFGIPIVYYIAPQLWAWAPKRILKIKKYFRKVLVVFEFEEKLYRDHGIPVVWVGHPLKDLIRSAVPKTGPPPDQTPVSLLPGSRVTEVRMLLPIFLEAAGLIREKMPSASFRLLKAPTLSDEIYRPLIEKTAVPLTPIRENPYETIGSSRLAIVCSGTATLECAILGTPMIVANRANWLTYQVVKSVIRVPYLGLPNLILGGNKVPEFIQYDATARKIADEALRLLTDTRAYDQMKKDLEEVSRRIGEGGAGRHAALEILKELQAVR